MSLVSDSSDRSDPAVRAGERLARIEATDRRRRTVASAALLAGAVALLALVVPFPGALVGAVAGAIALSALAYAAGPYEWGVAERRHHELDAIWHELRADADKTCDHDRYAAWANSKGQTVELAMIKRLPDLPREKGPLSPYRLERGDAFDADSLADAAEAMEALRAEAERREEKARTALERRRHKEADHAYESGLKAVDREAAEYAERRAAELARQDAAREAAERKAQAEALARALRRG